MVNIWLRNLLNWSIKLLLTAQLLRCQITVGWFEISFIHETPVKRLRTSSRNHDETGKEDILLEIKYTFLNDVMVSVVHRKYELNIKVDIIYMYVLSVLLSNLENFW